eukprot:404700-Pleurochrysis_carterae.AAC.3
MKGKGKRRMNGSKSQTFCTSTSTSNGGESRLQRRCQRQLHVSIDHSTWLTSTATLHRSLYTITSRAGQTKPAEPAEAGGCAFSWFCCCASTASGGVKAPRTWSNRPMERSQQAVIHCGDACPEASNESSRG